MAQSLGKWSFLVPALCFVAAVTGAGCFFGADFDPLGPLSGGLVREAFDWLGGELNVVNGSGGHTLPVRNGPVRFAVSHGFHRTGTVLRSFVEAVSVNCRAVKNDIPLKLQI